MKKKKIKNHWSVEYNQDKDNLPKQITLWNVNGSKQTISVSELVFKKINDLFGNILEDTEKYVLKGDYSFAYQELILRMELELKRLNETDGGLTKPAKK